MDYAIIGFIVYLITIFVIGVATFKANKSTEDYFLGGRRLNPWLVAFSERTSAESAWLLLGLPGAALATGFGEAWTALGCVLGIILYWAVIAKDLRTASEETKSITLPTFLASKFGEEEKTIKIIAGVIIIFFFVFYLAAQFAGAGKVLNVTFGLTTEQGVIIGAAAIIFYTMMGGFLAVVWTDLIQGIVMIAALVVLPVIGYIYAADKGLDVGKALAEAGVNFTSLTGGKSGWAGAAVVIGGLSWGFGYFGQPHLVTKFMAIKNSEQIKIGRRIAYAWAIPAFTGAFLIGIIGLTIYGPNAFSDVEFVMPALAKSLLPSYIAGFIVSGAIAAMMSTADSQLLVISSTVVEDLVSRTMGVKLSDKKVLLYSRLLTLATGVAALAIALTSKELIFAMVSYAWSGLGASFGPALILLLKWKKTTKEGVVASMLTGAIVSVVWKSSDFLSSLITERFSSFVLSFLAAVVVSLATRKKELE